MSQDAEGVLAGSLATTGSLSDAVACLCAVSCNCLEKRHFSPKKDTSMYRHSEISLSFEKVEKKRLEWLSVCHLLCKQIF